MASTCSCPILSFLLCKEGLSGVVNGSLKAINVRPITESSPMITYLNGTRFQVVGITMDNVDVKDTPMFRGSLPEEIFACRIECYFVNVSLSELLQSFLRGISIRIEY